MCAQKRFKKGEGEGECFHGAPPSAIAVLGVLQRGTAVVTAVDENVDPKQKQTGGLYGLSRQYCGSQHCGRVLLIQ